ncbi:MAG TPA: M48 family metalloprotease [Mycobacteriales bacterium]|nr:M48 family metalloprotease [Mycobacteriales bacterium]
MTDHLGAGLALAVLLLLAALVGLRTGTDGRPVLPLAEARRRRHDLLPVGEAVHARHRAFHRTLRPWTYVSLVVGVAVPVLFGLTPLGATVVDAVGVGPAPLRAALGGLALGALAELVTLPLAVRRERVLRRYGLSVRTWRSWIADAAKSAVLGAVLSGAALAALYAVLGAQPHWWWAWAAPGAALLVVLLSFVFPVLVEPLFLRFTPMADSPLRQRLLALAERGGVPVRDVLVADASRRTTALNAYVSGFGATRRVVVFDTLLRDAPAGEVEVVVAHELGHAARRDVLSGTALSALGLAALVCGAHLVLTSPALLRAAGADAPADPRSVGLLFAMSALAGLALRPLQNLLSRRIETRADSFALNLGRRPAVFATMQRRLALTNLADLDPGMLDHLLFASHPTTVQRIAAAEAFGAGAPLDDGTTSG